MNAVDAGEALTDLAWLYRISDVPDIQLRFGLGYRAGWHLDIICCRYSSTRAWMS